MSELDLGICVAAVVVGALIKAVTGMGFPLVAIPAISAFVSVQDAVSIIALPNVVMNAALCWRTRREARRTRDLPALGIAGMAGAVVGSWGLTHVPGRLLMLVLACILFAYVGLSLLRPRPSLAVTTAQRWSPLVGLGAGVMQGAVGISGPAYCTWLHSYRLPPGAFTFSVALLFLLSGGSQLAVLVATGLVSGTRLWIALAAVPLVLVMIPLGERIRGRLGSASFGRLVLGLLLLSGATLALRVLH